MIRSGSSCLPLILASSSPRRAEILRHAKVSFQVMPAEIDESRRAGESGAIYVERLARAKARAVASQISYPAIVLGADTTVVVAGQILGKPASPDDAREALALLSGRSHEVLTGIAARRTSDGVEGFRGAATQVTFHALSSQQIAEYVASGEPLGKAGSYAIQGAAHRFIAAINGDYFNVMGLPLESTLELLGELGWTRDSAI